MQDESGQTMVEFALICLVMLIISAGLIDAGRGFYDYNAMSSAARYGARWASVIGGTCLSAYGSSTSDWCDQLGGNTAAFWSQAGNKPLMTASATASCPSTYSSTFTGYYRVSDYSGSGSTTIVGAIAQRFDTDSSRRNFIRGLATPGFDLTQLKVCIQLPYNSSTGGWSYKSGDSVGVYLYYPFQPVSMLLINHSFNLTAFSEYTIE